MSLKMYSFYAKVKYLWELSASQSQPHALGVIAVLKIFFKKMSLKNRLLVFSVKVFWICWSLLHPHHPPSIRACTVNKHGNKTPVDFSRYTNNLEGSRIDQNPNGNDHEILIGTVDIDENILKATGSKCYLATATLLQWENDNNWFELWFSWGGYGPQFSGH